MTVELQTVRQAFVGTGAASNYAPYIYAQEAAQIEVTVDDLVVVGYALTGLNSPTGVVVNGTFALGSEVVIRRVTPLVQQVDTRNQQTILENVLNAALDRAILVDQELSYRTGQAIRMPEGDPGFVVPENPARQNTFFGFAPATGLPTLFSTTALAAALAADLATILPVVAKGDPGANVMAIGLFTAAPTLNIPVGTNIVRTSGYSADGIGVADYVLDAAVDAAYVIANPLTSFRTVNGRGFRLIYEGGLNVTKVGAKGDWNGAVGTDNRNPIQAACNFVNAQGGGFVIIPAGVYDVSAYITVPANVTILGWGRRSSRLTTNALGGGGANNHENLRNGSLLVSIFPINSSTAANINLHEIGLECRNAANVGAGYYDRGGTFIAGRNVRVLGFKNGLVLDQSELVDFEIMDFEQQLAGGKAAWLVSGADLTPGAAGGFTNRISINRSQINEAGTVTGIVDDGGYNHVYQDNNYNGCLNHLRVAGVAGLEIRGGEFESAAGPPIAMRSTTFAGGGAGGSFASVWGGSTSAGIGQQSIDCGTGAGTLSVGGSIAFTGGGGTAPAVITGVANLFRFWLGSYINATVGPIPLLDGKATQHHDTTGGPTVPAGQQLLLDDASGAGWGGYADFIASSPYRILRLGAKAGGATWQTAVHFELNYNGGAVFTPFKVDGNTDGATAAAKLLGTFDVTHPVPANAQVSINGTKVLGPRQVGTPAAAADLASVIALANFLRTAGLAHGHIG